MVRPTAGAESREAPKERGWIAMVVPAFVVPAEVAGSFAPSGGCPGRSDGLSSGGAGRPVEERAGRHHGHGVTS
ncbi:hypothetical protein GCM10010488_12550 [Oerskovia jenensis]